MQGDDTMLRDADIDGIDTDNDDTDISNGDMEDSRDLRPGVPILSDTERRENYFLCIYFYHQPHSCCEAHCLQNKILRFAFKECYWQGALPSKQLSGTF